MDSTNINLGLVQDVNGLDKLRKMSTSSLEEKKDALLAAAEQFESILNQFWLKAMRATNDAICPDSPLKSSDSGIFQSMLDEQMVTSVAMANRGNKTSLSSQIVKQFAQSMGDDGKEILRMLDAQNNKPLDTSLSGFDRSLAKNMTIDTPIATVKNLAQDEPCSQDNDTLANIKNEELNTIKNVKAAKAYKAMQDNDNVTSFNDPQDFVNKLMPLAVKVARKFNLNPLVIVAQAALETGWGKHIGANNNFFGIKSSKSWQGQTELMASDEYVNGVRVSQVSSFRAYNSTLSSIEDYARLISSNDRYSKAHAVSNNPDKYFEEIQKAGYATDPQYANKLKGIIRNEAFSKYL